MSLWLCVQCVKSSSPAVPGSYLDHSECWEELAQKWPFRCPHVRDVCRNKNSHPRHDVVYLKNAEGV